MTSEEKKSFRENVAKDFMEKDLEIETTLSYITIGSLCFFITLTEKFLKLQNATCKGLFIISLIFLFISFILILIRKHTSSLHDRKMLDFIDKMAVNDQADDQQLMALWARGDHELKYLRCGVYFSLGIGVGMQLLYIILNYKILIN